MMSEVLLSKTIYFCFNEDFSLSIKDLRKVFDLASFYDYSVDCFFTDTLLNHKSNINIPDNVFIIQFYRNLVDTDMLKLENGKIIENNNIVKDFLQSIKYGRAKILVQIEKLFGNNVKVLEEDYFAPMLENLR